MRNSCRGGIHYFFSLEKNSLKEHCESVFYVLRADLGLACGTVRAV